MNKVKAVVSLILITCLFLPSTPHSQTGYRNIIVIEGEDAITTNFAKEPTFNLDCSGQKALQLSTSKKPSLKRGYFAEYVFTNPQNRKYDLWIGVTPPGSRYSSKTGYASPFRWKLDDGKFTLASSENTKVGKYYAAGGFYWIRLSRGILTKGKHKLVIEVDQKRSSGWDYFLYIDSMIFIPVDTNPKNFIPKVKVFPKKRSRLKVFKLRSIQEYKRLRKRKRLSENELFTLANCYIWLFDYKKAIHVLNQLSFKYPRKVRYRILAAKSRAWSGKIDLAIRDYKRILVKFPRNTYVRKSMAIIAGWNNRYNEAIKQYKNIIRVDPNNIDAYLSIATVYSWSKRSKEALGWYEKASARFPNNVKVKMTLAKHYSWSGKMDAAIRELEKVIRIDKYNIKAYKQLAKFYRWNNQPKKAKLVIKKLLARFKDPSVYKDMVAVFDETEKNRLLAIKNYLAILKVNPENLSVRESLAKAYVWNNMGKEAVSEYKKIIDIRYYKKLIKTENDNKNLFVQYARLKIMEDWMKKVSPRLLRSVSDLEDITKTDSKYKSIITRAAKIQNYLKGKLNSYALLIRKNEGLLEKMAKLRKSFLANIYKLGWTPEINSLISKSRDNIKLYKTIWPRKIIASMYTFLNRIGSSIDTYKDLGIKRKPEISWILPILHIWNGNIKSAKNTLALLPPKIRGKVFSSVLADFLSIEGIKLDIKNSSGSGILDPKKLRKKLLGMYIQIGLFQNQLKSLYGLISSAINTELDYALFTQAKENTSLRKEIGNFNLREKKVADAIFQYEKVLKVLPGDSELKLLLSEIYGWDNKWKKSQKLLTSLLTYNPDNKTARNRYIDLNRNHAMNIHSDFKIIDDTGYNSTKINAGWSDYLGEIGKINLKYSFINQIETAAVTNTSIQAYDLGADYKGNYTAHVLKGGIEFAFGKNFSINPFASLYSFEVEDIPIATNNHTFLGYGADVFIKMFDDAIVLQLQFANLPVMDRAQTVNKNISKMTGGIELSLNLFERLSLGGVFRLNNYSDTNNTVSIETGLNLHYAIIDSSRYGFKLSPRIGISYLDRLSDYKGALPFWIPLKRTTGSFGVGINHNLEKMIGTRLSYYLSYSFGMNNNKEKSHSLYFAPSWHIGDFLLNAVISYYTSKAETADDPYKNTTYGFNAGLKFYSSSLPGLKVRKSDLYVQSKSDFMTMDNDGKDDTAVFEIQTFDASEIKKWEFIIKDINMKLVRSYKGLGNPPSTLEWKGYDSAKRIVKAGDYNYCIKIENGLGQLSQTRAKRITVSKSSIAVRVTVTPSFSPNGDGAKDVCSIKPSSTSTKGIKKWVITIKDRRKKDIRVFSGLKKLPYGKEWNGKDAFERKLRDGEYKAQCEIEYNNGIKIVSSEVAIVLDTKTSASIRSMPDSKNINAVMFNMKSREKADIVEWSVVIYHTEGYALRTISGIGVLPDSVSWDGKLEKNLASEYGTRFYAKLIVKDRSGNSYTTGKTYFTTRPYVFTTKRYMKVITFSYNKKNRRFLNPLFALINNKFAEKGKRIIIAGYTHMSGLKDQNILRSKNNAKAMQKMLTAAYPGLGSAIMAGGNGGTNPFRSTGTINDKKWNDRIEITVYFK